MVQKTAADNVSKTKLPKTDNKTKLISETLIFLTNNYIKPQLLVNLH